MTGVSRETTLALPVEGAANGADRLGALGLNLIPEGDAMLLEEPFPGTPFFDTMTAFDFYGDESVTVVTAQAEKSQLPQELVFLPAFLLLAVVIWLQRGRAAREETSEVPA